MGAIEAMVMKDKPLTVDEATGPLDPNTPKEPGHDAWLETQLRQAIRHADENPDDVVSHDEVFASLDRIIEKYKKS